MKTGTKGSGPKGTKTSPVDRGALAGVLLQLSEALSEGEFLLPALVNIADSTLPAGLQGPLRDIAARVRAGEDFSASVKAQRSLLPSLEIERLRIAESDGRLAETLAILAGEMAPLTERAVSVFEVGDFTREFAALVGAGTSLVRSLQTLAEKQHNTEFKRVIEEVNAGVQNGSTLSKELANHPLVFEESYVNAVKAGELNGTLDWTLHGVAHLDDILNFDQTVQFLGTSKATLYRLLNEERIRGLRVGRQWRFRKTDLLAYLEKKPEPVSRDAQQGIEDELRYFDSLTVQDQDFDAPSPPDGEPAVVRLVNQILLFAIESGASDIHLELAHLDGQVTLLLRQRLDGLLHEVRRLPEKLAKPVFNRIKVMADLSIEERILPQDGRIAVKYKDANFDFRVNLTPTAYGGSLVIRLLAQPSKLVSFDSLGLHPLDAERLSNWLSRPSGLILAAAPAHSGKTTTLYAGLNLKVGAQVKTVTIEDPLEYPLPYATQVHANNKGLTLSVATRALLRQDPDIILIAELRDIEITELAHHAALSGHLVLSTLTVGSTVEALRRLLEMNTQPFIVGSSVVGIVSQRLARRNCEYCTENYIPSQALVNQLRQIAAEGGYRIPEATVFKRGQGCEKCRGAGLRGRIGIFELLEMNEAILEALSQGQSPADINNIAIQNGMTSLAADGARKAAEGIVSIEELLRVLFLSART